MFDRDLQRELEDIMMQDEEFKNEIEEVKQP